MYAPVSVSGPIGRSGPSNLNRRRGGGGGNRGTGGSSSKFDLFLRGALIGAFVSLVSALAYLNYEMTLKRLGGATASGDGDQDATLTGLRNQVETMKGNLATMGAALQDATGMSGALERYECTPEIAKKQEDRLKSRNHEWWSHSACTDQLWIERLIPNGLLKSNDDSPYLVLDVGCNKGYTSADFLDALSPGAGMNPDSLVTAIRSIEKEDNVKYDRDCGVCNDCKKELNKDRSSVREVDIHCFEPSPATYGMLTRVQEKLKVEENSKQSARWHVHNLGLHETSGNMAWHKACNTAVGDELCTIVPDGTPESISVGVVTVDDFLEKNLKGAQPVVHVLKIDAEGIDPAVLKGAERTLREQRAIFVVFEFNPQLSEKGDHPHGMWGRGGKPHKDLLEVTNWLDELSYDCFLDSKVDGPKNVNAPPLYMITGGCLSKEPDVRGWANVVCASRAYPAAAKELRKLATLLPQ